MEDLVTDGQLCLKPLKHQKGPGLQYVCVCVCVHGVSVKSVNDSVNHLVRTELLSEADVRAGHVYSQAVLHPLQERHPALTLLLKTLPPQRLRLQLTAHQNTNRMTLRDLFI